MCPSHSLFRYFYRSHGFKFFPFSSIGFSSSCCTSFPYIRFLSYTNFIWNSGANSCWNLYFGMLLRKYSSRYDSVACLPDYGSKRKNLDGVRAVVTREQVLGIVDLVCKNDDELESKLESLNVRLSVASVAQVFQMLDRRKEYGLRFFRWVRCWQPELGRNADFCSLVIDNCGRLDDYDAMRSLLDEFSSGNLCLSKKAFGFLRFAIASDVKIKRSTLRLIQLLREVGGSCYASGMHSLIDFFCGLGSFDMAKFVIDNVEKKVSYYNLLIKEMCCRCDFKTARELLNEMRKEGCEPRAQTYNYIISSLCQLDLVDVWVVCQEMRDKNCPPDSLTFEILICHCCRHRKFEDAFQLLHDMDARRLEPRLSTHAAIIKGFFRLQRYEEAYTYVVNSADKYKHSGNMIYSLLASLHEKKGNLVTAQHILSEMIKKGLRPEFNVYLRVLKHIQTSGRAELAIELREQFLQLEVTTQ